MKLMRLTTCGNGFDANVLQSKLEKLGIRSLIKNEIMGGYPPLSTCAVFVDDGDLPRARKVVGNPT